MRICLVADRIIDFFLAGAHARLPLPQRVRIKGLAFILLACFPLLSLAFCIDLFHNPGPFSWGLLVASVAVLLSLIFLRFSLWELAVDVSFFATCAAIASGYLFSLYTDPQALSYYPLVVIAFFAGISFMGLHSSDRVRALVFVSIALAFDVGEIFLLEERSLSLIYIRLTIILLHFLAFYVALFLNDYVNRLNGIAEARRLMNRSLEDILAQLKTENLKKLHSLGHDLRSPITAIMGVQSLLASTDLSEEQRRYLDILSRSNGLLLHMADSVFEPAGANIDTSYPMRRLIEAALEPFAALIKAKGLTVHIDVGTFVPSPPLSRAHTIRILSNLIDNALRYSDAGRITISAQLKKAGAQGEEFWLSVTDQGRGITPARIKEIEAGEVTPDPDMPDSHGLGLNGIQIILVEVGGLLKIDSRLGSGTTVQIRIPL